MAESQLDFASLVRREFFKIFCYLSPTPTLKAFTGVTNAHGIFQVFVILFFVLETGQFNWNSQE